jgi:site-specific DNA-methyltransferase (adenine-specific)
MEERRMKPYFDKNGITIYHAQWEDVVSSGAFDPRDASLLHSDPPYGVAERTKRASAGRGKHSGSRALATANDFPAVVGDDQPYNPAPLLALDRPLVAWGANHYASRLPDSPSWIVWDKREGVLANDNADGEAAWTNLGGPLRIFSHLWAGMLRASERGSSLHPTQKPVELSLYVFRQARLSPGDLVFVPHMGSGPDIPAARAMGLRVVACDVEQWCCETAVQRIGETVDPSLLHKRGKPRLGDTTASLFPITKEG